MARLVRGFFLLFWKLLMLLAVFFAGSVTAVAQPVEGQVLVKFRGAAAGGGPQLQTVRRLPAGARVLRSLPLAGWQSIALPPDLPVRRAIAWFRNQPEVLAVEPNHRYRAHRVPDDPEFARLYGLERIGAPAAWDQARGDSSVVVAVFDTGMDLTHPDLIPNLWANPGEVAGNGIDDDANGWVDDVHGVDVVDGDGDPADDAGHGTHVAGTIGAAGHNGRGVVGVAWQVRLMPVRVLSVDGSATTAEFVSAFDYAVRLRRRGVNLRVINCSWGGGFPSLALKEAMEAAAAEGILLVCSAGNDQANTDALPTFPAAYDIPEILAVGASTVCDEPSSFSNYGRRTVDLAAPGSGILSTFRGGERYAEMSGTSMAAPHVSGALAVLAGMRPNAKPSELRALILGTVDPVPAWDGKSLTGGRLNLAQAVERARTSRFPPEPVLPGPAAGRVTLVSRAPNGRWGNGRSFQPALSADGRWVAFVSAATNLVNGDTEGTLDVFLIDRNNNAVQRVSQTPAGLGGNGDSSSPSVSADGRFVAFVSLAGNLVSNDLNGVEDIFLWDRNSRQIELISVRSDGRGSANGLSEVPIVNRDGSVVAFASDATDVVAQDGNQVRDVFVRDRSRRVTERVSVASDGSEGADWSDAPTLSADGRTVAFHSGASNLVPGDANQKWDIFIRSRSTGTTEILGGALAGDGDSIYPLLSADGNWVAFSSAATSFGGGPTAGSFALFLYDRTSKQMIRTRPSTPENRPQTDVYAFGISGDGRFVSLTTDDPGMGPGGELGFYRSYLFDRLRGTHEPVAISDAGYVADDSSYYAPISPDGRWVAFVSNAHGLVPGDGNAEGDVFLLDRGEAVGDLSARGVGGALFSGEGIPNPAVPQRVGQSVAAGQTAEYDVRLDNAAGSRSFVLRTAAAGPGWALRASVPGNGGPIDVTAALTGAGWTTAQLPAGSNLVLRVAVTRSADTVGETVFTVRILVATTTATEALDAVSLVTTTSLPPPGWTLASRGPDGRPASRSAESPSLSGDGRWVAFASEADDLDDRGDLNLQSDVFVADRTAGTIRRVSDASATVQGNADSRSPSLSADGTRLVFQSRADNLVPGDSNGVEDIFLKDLRTGQTTRVSVSSSGAAANRGSERPFLAGGGHHVVFTSFASNLVDGDDNRARDVFVRDLQSGTTECVSRSVSGAFGDADSEGAVVSADGRFVVFSSFAANLGPTDGNGYADVYLWDRSSRTLELVSANAQGVAANGSSVGGGLSDDGRWLTFASYATDLLPGGSPGERQSYLLDRSTRTLRRVAELVGPLSQGLEVRSAAVSPDGRWLGLTGSRACAAGRSVAQVLVYDLNRARLDLVSATRAGEWGDDHSFPARFAAQGRHLAFESAARNLLLEPSLPAGQVYVAEWIATDPTLPGEPPRLNITAPAAGPVTLTWRSTAGLRYRVERSAEPGLGFVEAPAGPIEGTGDEISWVEPGPATGSSRFYRLRAEAP